MSKTDKLKHWVLDKPAIWADRATTNGGLLMRAIPFVVYALIMIFVTSPVYFTLLVWDIVIWCRQKRVEVSNDH